MTWNIVCSFSSSDVRCAYARGFFVGGNNDDTASFSLLSSCRRFRAACIILSCSPVLDRFDGSFVQVQKQLQVPKILGLAPRIGELEGIDGLKIVPERRKYGVVYSG